MSVRPVTHLEAAPPAPPSDETVPDSSHGPGSSPARLGPRQGSHPPSGPWQVLEAVTASAPGFLNCFLPGRGGEKVAVPDTCLPRGRTRRVLSGPAAGEAPGEAQREVAAGRTPSPWLPPCAPRSGTVCFDGEDQSEGLGALSVPSSPGLVPRVLPTRGGRLGQPLPLLRGAQRCLRCPHRSLQQDTGTRWFEAG